jgi:hypothetical protein
VSQLYFGDWGDVPTNQDKTKVETPVGEVCLHCEEAVLEGDMGSWMGAIRLARPGEELGVREHQGQRFVAELRVIQHRLLLELPDDGQGDLLVADGERLDLDPRGVDLGLLDGDGAHNDPFQRPFVAAPMAYWGPGAASGLPVTSDTALPVRSPGGGPGCSAAVRPGNDEPWVGGIPFRP